jgi:methylenetetrahydrofolate dehydrogenase (NADP+)/methenyltetrahydrofolate cyclohydrolase
MIKLLAKPVTDLLQSDIIKRTAQFAKTYGRNPKLVVVLVGDDPASLIYTRRKGEVAVSLGMAHETYHLPESSTPEEVKDLIHRLNRDPKVDGILVQRPLPKGFVEEEVLYWVHPDKDVDAFHPENAGRLFLGLPAFQPCTPAGIMELLRFYGIQIEGKIACIVGRSSIVGKPMAALLLQANATVLHCHSKTPDLERFTKQADLLVVAAGKRGLIQSQHIKPGAVVIDVGMHRTPEGKLSGDVAYDNVISQVSAITPVPGGVGPMTITILMQNTIRAAELREAATARSN